MDLKNSERSLVDEDIYVAFLTAKERICVCEILLPGTSFCREWLGLVQQEDVEDDGDRQDGKQCQSREWLGVGDDLPLLIRRQLRLLGLWDADRAVGAVVIGMKCGLIVCRFQLLV